MRDCVQTMEHNCDVTPELLRIFFFFDTYTFINYQVENVVKHGNLAKSTTYKILLC